MHKNGCFLPCMLFNVKTSNATLWCSWHRQTRFLLCNWWAWRHGNQPTQQCMIVMQSFRTGMRISLRITLQGLSLCPAQFEGRVRNCLLIRFLHQTLTICYFTVPLSFLFLSQEGQWSSISAKSAFSRTQNRDGLPVRGLTLPLLVDYGCENENVSIIGLCW